MSFLKNKIKKILRKTHNFLSNEEEEKNTYKLDFKENPRFLFPNRQNKEHNPFYSQKKIENENGTIKIQIFDYRNNSQSLYEINSIRDIKRKKEKEFSKKNLFNKNWDIHNLSHIEPEIKIEKQQHPTNNNTEKTQHHLDNTHHTLNPTNNNTEKTQHHLDNTHHTLNPTNNNTEKTQHHLDNTHHTLNPTNNNTEKTQHHFDNTHHTLNPTNNNTEKTQHHLDNTHHTLNPTNNNTEKTQHHLDNTHHTLNPTNNNTEKTQHHFDNTHHTLNSTNNNTEKTQHHLDNTHHTLNPTNNNILTSYYNKKSNYQIPIEILKYSSTLPKSEAYAKEINETSDKIENIIKEYGIECNVIHTQKGPIITRYEIELPRGMKLNKLTSLEGELKVHLAALSVRMAPVIGKSTIGIEIPNSNRENLFLGDIFRKIPSLFTEKNLSVPIGKDITGKEKIINISKLPHLLIAGSTGSGKSVCLNSMISSLIYRLSPEEVQFVIIDPKMVELTLYCDIPHLMLPVITNPKFALQALHYIILEMEKRYQTLSELKCRNLIDYNLKIKENTKNSYINKKYKYFPYIIIFIDELSDLMITAGKELEDLITRITQKARAVGIHLIMATQRPSVDIITGLIKANCPARIAFSVAQKTDSQTILDQTGAETLLGQGDFLYRSPVTSNLERIQAPYISESEIEKIVEYAKSFGKPNYQLDFKEENHSYEFSPKDETLIEEAWKIIKTHNKASGSFLQRKLSIGYNKAAGIIETLEERGFIGPENGPKPRDILK